jgi:hypothetical protein
MGTFPPPLHPDQPTRFFFAWVNDPAMTYRQARAHFESMTVTVVWDDGSSALNSLSTKLGEARP